MFVTLYGVCLTLEVMESPIVRYDTLIQLLRDVCQLFLQHSFGVRGDESGQGVMLESFPVIVSTMYKVQPFPQSGIFSCEFEHLIPVTCQHQLELPQELLHEPCVTAIAGAHFGALFPCNRAIMLLLKVLHNLCSEVRFLSNGK